MRAKDDLDSTTDQRRGGVRSFLFLLAGLGLLATAVLGVGGYLGYREAKSPGPSDTATVVLLEPGSAVSTIAYTLQDAGVIRNAEFFTAVVRMRRAQSGLKAGEYEIRARASLMDIIDLLIEGKSILHYFTAPEGLTTAQILRLISADQTLVTEITLEPPEGELLPETYAFTRGETRDEIIRRMMKSQDALIDEIWDGRAMELPFSTPAEAIILASIVEKETGIAAERTRIAAVFVNRLKRNMRLESDPTIIYGLTKGEPLGRGLRQSELRGRTPYNTYVIRGLPPTPIGNPGRAAIEAVLHPAETDEIFFVADGTGGHVFSSTNRDHERNVAQWRRVERERRQGG
ncbi:MAG: endolytic transglycosylase MltG [Alphaproteobacteria bacterium]|nr:endolytic transglycosylase MltG [Alphaproteobacteria bacterium]